VSQNRYCASHHATLSRLVNGAHFPSELRSRPIKHVAIRRYRTRPIGRPGPALDPARVCSPRRSARAARTLEIPRTSPHPFVGLPPDLVPPFRRVCVSLRNTTLTTELAALARAAWSRPRHQTAASFSRASHARPRARLAARGRPARRTPLRLRGIGHAVCRVSPVGLTNTRNAARPMLLVSPCGLRCAAGAPTNPPTKHGRDEGVAPCFWGGLRSPGRLAGGWGEMRRIGLGPQWFRSAQCATRYLQDLPWGRWTPWAITDRTWTRTIRREVLSVHAGRSVITSKIAAVHRERGGFRGLATAFSPAASVGARTAEREF